MPRAIDSLISALAVLAASGCIVVTRPVTHEVVVGVEESEPTDSGGFVAWDITTRIEPDMANVAVTAVRVQPCTRLRSEVYDELGSEGSQVVALGGGGGAAGFGGASALGIISVGLIVGGAVVLFSPVTAVTWIVAKREIANHHDTKTRKTRTLETIRGTCPRVAANVPVELTLPSGAVLTGTTGSDGRASFAIPEAEPDYGTALTRVADQMRSVAFYRTTSACQHARDEIFSRVIAAAAVEERSELLHALPTACGDARARAWSLTATAALDAVGSRCESIKSLAGQVRAIDRGLYDSVFVSDSDIAHCLDGSTVARQHHTACIEQRRAAMQRAQQSGITERTRILTSLPRCD